MGSAGATEDDYHIAAFDRLAWRSNALGDCGRKGDGRGMGHIIGLNHVAVMVSDLERSRHFYHDLLGLPIMEYTEHHDGAISEVTATPHTHMKEDRLGVPAILGYGEPRATFAFTLD